MLQENIRNPIHKNEKTLHSFHGHRVLGARDFEIPSPSPPSKTAHPTSKSDEAVEEENTTFDEVRQAVEDGFSALGEVNNLRSGERECMSLRIFLSW